MALKMADDSGLEGSGKRKRHSGLLTDELQAMRERSMSVQVGRYLTAYLRMLWWQTCTSAGSSHTQTSPDSVRRIRAEFNFRRVSRADTHPCVVCIASCCSNLMFKAISQPA